MSDLDHRMIQVGRDLRRSLVHPPKGRASCEIEPDCSGLYPDGSCKPLGMGMP